MYRRKYKGIMILSLCILVTLSCERERINPLDPENPNSDAVVLPPPTGLKAIPDYGTVILTWDAVTDAVRYQIYRDDEQITTNETTNYEDTGLTPGQEYKYQVASVHSSGLGGHKSDPVYATPIKGARVKYSKYEVYADDNGDGMVNRGENVTIKLYLKNTGTDQTNGVKAYMSEDDDYVTITDNYGSFGTMTVNEEDWQYYSFEVSSSCSNGHLITFSLNISDSDGHSWSDTFTITVQATGANIEYSKHEVYSDDNNDRIVNRGENVTIKLYLKNTGSSSANGVKAYLSENDTYVTISDNYGSYSTLTPNEEAWSYYTFEVSTNCPYGYVVTFYLNISDNDGNSWADTFAITVEETNANIKYSKYEVYSDDNGDGILNRGETVTVKLYLKNEGLSSANGVKTYLSENDTYITITDNYGSFSTLTPGEEAWSYYTFDISTTCPYGHVVTFYLNISDNDGNAWADTFTVTVQKTGANIEFSKYEVYSDNNSNGQVNPGESITLKIYLQNTGSSNANGVKAYLSENDSHVTVTDNYGSFSTLTVGEEAWAYYSFNVSSSCPSGHTITFSLSISDSDGNSWSDSFTVSVQ